MCNQLHKNSKDIKKEGVGYKIFRNNIVTKFAPCFGWSEYIIDEDGWVRWDNPSHGDEGFCFFMTKSAANKTLKIIKKVPGWGSAALKVYKIKYRAGIGSHLEKGIAIGLSVKIALCKEFKVIDE